MCLLAISAMRAGAAGSTTLFCICHPCPGCHFCNESHRERVIRVNSLLDYPFSKGQIFKSLSFPCLSCDLMSHFSHYLLLLPAAQEIRYFKLIKMLYISL